MCVSSNVPDEVPLAAPSRRSFLGICLATVGGLVSAVLAIPLVRFVTFPLQGQVEELAWSDVGKLEDFRTLNAPVARTITVNRTDGWRRSALQDGVYVVPTGSGNVKVLSSVCPHLGCTLRWVSEASKFKCPCHGGTFTSAGVHIAGPPLRAMDELESKVENGILKVRFQHFRQLIAEKEPIG